MSDCAKHLSWTRKLFWELASTEPWHEEVKYKKTSFATDITAAKSLAENMNVSARGKHIDLRVHHVNTKQINQITKRALQREKSIFVNKNPCNSHAKTSIRILILF